MANRPQDPYALAKVFGEQLMDAAVARSDLRAISIRPVLGAVGGQHTSARSGRGCATRSAAPPSESFWSYIDVYDLAHALRLAAESSLEGHEAMYVVSPDNAAGRPLAGADRPPLRRRRSTVGELAREDAGGISSAKAERLIGYRPTRSWRDYLSPTACCSTLPASGSPTGRPASSCGRAALS